MNKWIKISLKIVAVLLILMIGTMIILPYFFKDEIIEKIKVEANKSLNATLDFSDVDISFFRSFPKLSLGINDVLIVGHQPFESDTLAKIDAFHISTDLASIIKSSEPITVHSVHIARPQLNLIVNKQGKSNFDIVKKTETSTNETSDWRLQLEDYAITEGDIIYTNQAQNDRFHLENFNHRGHGDFSNMVFDLESSTNIESVSVVSGNLPYLSNVELNLESILACNMEQMHFDLKDTYLFINALQIAINGNINLQNKPVLDINFNAPSNSIKGLVSLLPGSFKSDFENIKTDGLFTLSGNVKGNWDPENQQYPKFNFDLKIKDGHIKYPNFNQPITNIQTDISAKNTSHSLDNMYLDIKGLRFEVDDSHMYAKANISNPISDPKINLESSGNLQLENLAEAYPMPNIQSLKGNVDYDIHFNGSQSDIENKMEGSSINGFALVNNFEYVSDGLLPANIREARVDISNQELQISSLAGSYGSSDFKGSISMDQPLKILDETHLINAKINLNGHLFDVDQIMAQNETTQSANTELHPYLRQLWDRVNANIHASVDKVNYEPYLFENNLAEATLKEDKLLIKSYGGKVRSSDIKLEGELSNLYDFSMNEDTLRGELNLTSDQLVLEDFITEEIPTDSHEAASTSLPPNNQIEIHSKIKKLSYGNTQMKNAEGDILLLPYEAILQDFHAYTLGGKVNLEGKFNTENTQYPQFEIDLDLDKLKFVESINSVPAFAKLMPIAKHLEGIFNTSIKMKGNLLEDMSPDLSTLTGTGYLETLDTRFKDFTGVEKIKNLFNLQGAKEWVIDKSRNWIDIESGKVILKPVTYTFEGIDFDISGTHSLDNEMDFDIKAKVPRETFAKSKLGSQANSAYSSLINSINKKGINIEESEYINVDIGLSGFISDPKLSFDPVGSSTASISDAIADHIDQSKNEAIDTVNTLVNQSKDSVNIIINETKDSIKSQIESKKDSLKEEVSNKTNEAKDQLLNAGKDALFGKKDSTDQNKEGSVIDQLFGKKTKTDTSESNKWNPFKKKKN